MSDPVPEEVSELQDSLNSFMNLLMQNINAYLGEDGKFSVNISIKLAVTKNLESKMQEYQQKLKTLVNNIPQEFVPKEK